MKSTTTTLWAICCVLLVGACQDAAEPTDDAKPTADPDAALSGKADGLSNHYTTVMGELLMDDIVRGAIDYPDWFHGYTIELEAGQTVQFTTWADAVGVVNLYGPALETSVGLRYGRPAVRSWANYAGSAQYNAEFEIEVEESGTYMLVYGPYYVWNAAYDVSTKCFAGCETDPPAAGACSSNADCTDGWCRATDGYDVARECVPFVGEGAQCGGFTLPHMQEACEPDLDCVFRPFIADAPGTCRNVVTVAELTADGAAYDGERVSIDGYINTGHAICTQMACTPDNPCCNSCGASQTLVDEPTTPGEGLTLEEDGETYGCGGDSCNYQDNCSIDVEGEVRIVGTYETAQFGPGRLVVESVTPLEHL